MPGVTKEQIQAAREADLFAYLQFHEPGVLKRDGPNYRHKEHDSLVYVTGKRYWYWNSRGRSINALDYLIQIRGYGLVDAVHTLVGGEIQQAPAYRSATEKAHVQKEPEKKPFSLPWVRRCATSAVSYLQRRGISSDVIGRCFRKGLFYEARYHGEPVCVFAKRSLPVCGALPAISEKMFTAATRNIASAIHRGIRAAAMWRSLRHPLTPFPMPRCRN